MASIRLHLAKIERSIAIQESEVPMTFLDLARAIEEETCQIQKARAVLYSASASLEAVCTEEQERARLLLDVTDSIMVSVLPKLDYLASALIESHQLEKQKDKSKVPM